MSIKRQKLRARHIRVELTNNSFPRFSECRKKILVSLPPEKDPPSCLKLLLTSPKAQSKSLRKNTCPDESSLDMACVNAEWFYRGLVNSVFNCAMTVRRRIFRYIAASLPPANF